MKRRVLNAASNKKSLRQTTAATGARAPYRVLCDASFLRVAFDYFRHYRKAGENLSRRELEATLPSLETLFTEMFGTQQYFLQTTVESQDDFHATYQNSHSNTGAKKAQQQKELDEQLMMGANAATAATHHKKPVHAPHPKLVADAHLFLRKFELIGDGANDSVGFGDDDATKKAAQANRRNERKAIISTLNDVADGKPVNGHAHPLISYFVATLNHDLKAMLRKGEVAGGRVPIPTIRMTFNPWLLWLDAGESSGAFGTNPKYDVAAVAVPTNDSDETNTSSFKTLGSRADRAFLHHLTKESASFAANLNARDKLVNSSFGQRKKNIAVRVAVSGNNSQVNNNQKKDNNNMRAPGEGANPLSKKTKRQRETIVANEEDVPLKQHRTEKK